MSSAKSKKKRPHGQIRQSQVIMTFGPGSMFDLPNHAVIVGGLDYWTKGDEVHEPRLLAKLKELLKVPTLALYAPPPADDDPESTKKTGIDSIQFPEWFMTQSSQVQESRQLQPVAPAGSPDLAQRRQQVHRRGQEIAPGRADPVREGVQEGPHRRHRLVRLCPRRGDDVPAAALDR